MACKDWDHPLPLPRLRVTADSGKVSPKKVLNVKTGAGSGPVSEPPWRPQHPSSNPCFLISHLTGGLCVSTFFHPHGTVIHCADTGGLDSRRLAGWLSSGVNGLVLLRHSLLKD